MQLILPKVQRQAVILVVKISQNVKIQILCKVQAYALFSFDDIHIDCLAYKYLFSLYLVSLVGVSIEVPTNQPNFNRNF